MSDVAVIGVEGVLAKRYDDSESFANAAPIMPGLKLLSALATMHKVALLTDEEDTGPVEHFLSINGVRSYAYLLGRKDWQASYSHAELRLAQLQEARGQLGLVVGVVVDPDPSVAAEVLRSGLVALVFGHPSYQRPEFRPDAEKGVKAWAEIEAEMTQQRELKGADPRLTPGIGV